MLAISMTGSAKNDLLRHFRSGIVTSGQKSNEIIQVRGENLGTVGEWETRDLFRANMDQNQLIAHIKPAEMRT